MGMVRGIKEGNIRDYLKRIEEARKAVTGIEILSGTEVDILEDGSLYLSDDSLVHLDWVVASIHGNFQLSRDKMTERLIRAIEHPAVCVIGHPTARLLLKRDGIDFDVEAVFQAAKEHKVALELNASIYRLDLNDILCKRAKDMGIPITIDCDAHHPRELDYRFGIFQARRGWLEKGDVLNTQSFEKLQQWIKARKR